MRSLTHPHVGDKSLFNRILNYISHISSSIIFIIFCKFVSSSVYKWPHFRGQLADVARRASNRNVEVKNITSAGCAGFNQRVVERTVIKSSKFLTQPHLVSKPKILYFSKESSQKVVIEGYVHALYICQDFLSPWKRSMCPVFSKRPLVD